MFSPSWFTPQYTREEQQKLINAGILKPGILSGLEKVFEIIAKGITNFLPIILFVIIAMIIFIIIRKFK